MNVGAGAIHKFIVLALVTAVMAGGFQMAGSSGISDEPCIMKAAVGPSHTAGNWSGIVEICNYTDPVYWNYGGPYPNRPDIAGRGSELTVVHKRGSIWSAKSSDSGQTWPVQVNTGIAPDLAGQPKISLGVGRVHLVAYNAFFPLPSDSETHAHYEYSLDNGATWSSPYMELMTSGFPGVLVGLQMASEGNRVHVATMKNGQLSYKNSTDNGATWSSEQTLVASGITNCRGIAVNGSKVYVVWNSKMAKQEVFCRISPDYGLTWGAPIQLTANDSQDSNASAVAAWGNCVHVVYTDYASGQGRICDLRSTDGGATWDPPKTVSGPSSKGKYAVVAIDGSSIYVVWQDSRDNYGYAGASEIYWAYSSDNGSSWSADIRVTNALRDSINPAICLTDSTLNLVWQDNCTGPTANDYRLYYARNDLSPGRVTHAPFRINSNAQFASMAASEGWQGNGTQGNPYVIENYDINGTGASDCIYIGNTTVHFIVRECYLHDASNLQTQYYGSAGIQLYNTINGIISHNYVSANQGGFKIWASSHISISNNTVRNQNYSGVGMGSSNNITLSDNNISYNRGGIYLDGSRYNQILRNQIWNNTDPGVQLYGMGPVSYPSERFDIISDNTVKGNWYHGIIAQGAWGCQITNNDCQYDGNGITISFSRIGPPDVCPTQASLIANNTCKHNSRGIYAIFSLYPQDQNNSYYHNIITNNSLSSSDNYDENWDDGYPSGGNYWGASYTGVDIYSCPNQDMPGPDGIGDTPYAISGGPSADHYPLMAPPSPVPPTYGVDLFPDAQSMGGTPETDVHYLLSITNTGNTDDTYDLAQVTTARGHDQPLLAQTNWTQNWTKQGLAIDCNGTYDTNYSGAPSVLRELDGTYKMWYTGCDWVTWRILYATSADGVTWTKQGIALSQLGSGYETYETGFPSVVKAGNEYKMWYSGYDGSQQKRILYANSSDGVNWTRRGLALDLGGTGESQWVAHPMVLREDTGEYKMWYSGYDGSNLHIFLANSSDGLTWTRQGLVLDHGEPYATMHVYGAAVVKDKDGYHMWYTGRRDVGGRILYASSPDGVNWTRHGFALVNSPSGYDKDSVDDPGVILDGPLAKMWYSGDNFSSMGIRTLYATSEYMNPQNAWNTTFRDETDSYNITSISVPSWQTRQFTVVVAIPPGARSQGWSNSTVTAASQNASGVSASATVNTTVSNTYEIRVVEGWNLISLPLKPLDLSMPKVLQDMGGDTLWDRAMWYDPGAPERWRQHKAGWPAAMQDLRSANISMGIWLNVTTLGDGTITVLGARPNATSILLHAGWNLVGYPSLCTNMTVAYAFWGTGVDAVEFFDATATYKTKVAAPSYIMCPGEGYWVHAVADTVWVVDW
jgi:parallel beta-helix repeat protein